jgi:hypothetical protein
LRRGSHGSEEPLEQDLTLRRADPKAGCDIARRIPVRQQLEGRSLSRRDLKHLHGSLELQLHQDLPIDVRFKLQRWALAVNYCRS